jgi:chromosomal replication initiation ATPase DnaA
LVNKVCIRYDVRKEFILTRCIGSRLHDSCRARSIILNLMRECYELSLPHIGRIFDRDHTTVLHHIDLKRYKKRYWQGHFTIWQEFEEFKKQLLEKP